MSQDTPTAPVQTPSDNEGTGFSEGVQTDPNASTTPVAPAEPMKVESKEKDAKAGGSIDPEKPKAKAAKPVEGKAKATPAGEFVMLYKVKYNGNYFEKGSSVALDEKTEAIFRQEGFIV